MPSRSGRNPGRFAPLLAALLMLAAFSALAPPAHAQSVEFPTTTRIRITPLDEPVKPLAGVAILQAQVDYSYFAGVPPAQATQVTLEVVEQPAWATVSISPSTLYFEVEPHPDPGMQQQARPQKVSILVATTADAPAFTPANVRIEARAHPNFPYGGSSAADSTLVTAHYFSLLDVDAPEEDVPLGKDEVRVPFKVENLGNAVTRVTFSVMDAPTGVDVNVPRPFTLDSRQVGGRDAHTVKDVTVRVRAPDGLHEAAELVLRVDAAYALDTRLAGAREEIVLHVEPAREDATPAAAGVSALGLLGGGAGVAAAVRRWGRPGA